MIKKLKNINFIIFDLDGVFYKGNHPLKGTKEIITFLNKNNIEYCFFTNNSTYKIQKYQEKLKVCGIDIPKKKIITTTKLILSYLKDSQINEVYVLGSKQLKSNIYKKYNKNELNPECIILGMNNDIRLKEISKVINIIGENTKIIAANPDELIPTKKGFDLECGVIIDIIKKYSKKNILVLGKPYSYGYEFILKKFNKNNIESLMIGDTYKTDILGAINSNIIPAWIKTGNKLPKNIKNNFIKLDSLEDLRKKIEKEKRL